MSSSESDLEMLRTLSDWSDSDSDHDTPFRIYKDLVNYTRTLDNYEFLLRFRVNKTQVESLLREIYPHLKVTGSRNCGISPLHQLLVALRFYALGSLISVVEFIGISKSATCRIVRDVSYAITHLYSKYIYVKNTGADFYKIAKFPQVLGVIDCTHIKIHNISGSEMAEEYKNRNGYFSLNVQAVCDANLMFMNVESNWPGSIHDATVFNNSVFKAQYESKLFGDKWLLGDNAYPLKPYLLTPLLNPKTKGEQLYNESHKITRNCIDKCFDVWKRRFPVLALTMRTSRLSANGVILATAILHNICVSNNIEDVPPEVNIPHIAAVPVPNAFNIANNGEIEELITDHFNNLDCIDTQKNKP